LNIKFHSLHWDNIDPIVVNAHKAVIDMYGIDCTYHAKNMDHGAWIDSVLAESDDELVGIMDIDCIPTNRKYLNHVIDLARERRHFIGTAQVSNHYHPATNIYAAPAFMVLHRDAYRWAKEYSFRANHAHKCDVAEYFCYMTEKEQFLRHQALYPNHVHLPKWRLSNYGTYGIGTYYSMGIYHNFESRMSQNINLFKHVCDTVLRKGDIIHVNELEIEVVKARNGL